MRNEYDFSNAERGRYWWKYWRTRVDPILYQLFRTACNVLVEADKEYQSCDGQSLAIWIQRFRENLAAKQAKMPEEEFEVELKEALLLFRSALHHAIRDTPIDKWMMKETAAWPNGVPKTMDDIETEMKTNPSKVHFEGQIREHSAELRVLEIGKGPNKKGADYSLKHKFEGKTIEECWDQAAEAGFEFRVAPPPPPPDLTISTKPLPKTINELIESRRGKKSE